MHLLHFRDIHRAFPNRFSWKERPNLNIRLPISGSCACTVHGRPNDVHLLRRHQKGLQQR